MKDLRDRVAVVTGGASGVGKALAKAFLAEGMQVVLADVEEPALKTTAEELGALGEVSSLVTDVRRFESLEALADHTYSTFGACHLLCNNAGVSVAQLNVWETTPNDWTWVHGVNVHGVMHGIQAFVPRMIEAGHEGLVMNTSSGDGGVAPLAGQSVYAASKAAVSILTECLDAQLAAETNLRATIFYPSGGMLATGIWTTRRNRPAELVRERPVPEGSEMTFEDFMSGMKAAGIELPVQDLDELAQYAVAGIKSGDFVIMIRREEMEQQLTDRAKKLAAGENPTGVIPGI
ncbi:MAG: SDR family NAD(P)-dependent oxidoreductase [Myxococcales bacterium]|nr:SDR family NAD(P)-dependent oxidoreductase [Myxococcales bacterium]